MNNPTSNRSIGSIPLEELRAQMRAAFSRMSGEKVISCLLKYHGGALLSRDMAYGMLKDDVLSYEDLGLEYVDDYVPAEPGMTEALDLGIELP